jgi:hypothetical protein
MPTMKMNLKQLALARDWIKNCQSQEGFDARSDDFFKDVSTMSDAEIESQIIYNYQGGVNAFIISCDPSVLDLIRNCTLNFLVAEDIRGYYAWYYQPALNMYLATSEDDSPSVLLTPEEYEEDSDGHYVAGRDIRNKLRRAGYTTDPRSNQPL